MNTARVTFLEDLQGVDYAFRQGETVDLHEASAERWIRRGKAVIAPAEQTSAPADQVDVTTLSDPEPVVLEVPADPAPTELPPNPEAPAADTPAAEPAPAPTAAPAPAPRRRAT